MLSLLISYRDVLRLFKSSKACSSSYNFLSCTLIRSLNCTVSFLCVSNNILRKSATVLYFSFLPMWPFRVKLASENKFSFTPISWSSSYRCSAIFLSLEDKKVSKTSPNYSLAIFNVLSLASVSSCSARVWNALCISILCAKMPLTISISYRRT